MFSRKLLSDADVERLADAVTVILEEIGIICQNAEMLRALRQWGAAVDDAAEVVRFPPALVSQFVAQIKKESVPGDDSGQVVFQAPGRPGLGTQIAQFFYDDQAGEARPGTRDDLITLCKLGSALHPGSAVGHSLLLREVNPLMEPLEAAMVLAEYAPIPGPAFAWDVRQADYLAEMGHVLGLDNWFSLGAVCFAHPLRFDKAVADRFVRLTRMGRPLGLTGMQVSGASTPVTPAGHMAVSAAEYLATWIAGRALNPNAALGGSIWAATIDMKTGEVSYSAPDAMLRAFALREFLSRWCGPELRVGGGEYASAKIPGLYAALEKAYKAMTIAAFTGYHPHVGEGLVDNGKTIGPVQILLDTEYTIGLESLGQPVTATPETIALDEILDIGFGFHKNHLSTEHTLRHYRQNLWCPPLLSRTGWNGVADEAAVLERVRLKAEGMIASYRKPEVDPDKLARIRQIVETARKKIVP